MLPVAASLSLTLDHCATTTTVTLDGATDSFTLNDARADDQATARVVTFLDHVSRLAGSSQPARVVSHNQAPTGAGLASSPASFPPLTLAASRAYGLELDQTELSRLARHGSGSATRSIITAV